MIIKGIDYYKEIIDAIKNDRLVVFAGAGVSMGEPTCLPGFKSLANSIAEGMVTSCESINVDCFLGKLEHDQQVKVRTKAKRLLTEANPKPNEEHRSIIKLFSSHDSIRIVTTNYDLMFEAACEELWNKRPKRYSAPAVPYGHSFYGIVHLHGCVEEPEFMVLTDEDFGRAYLLDGYASKFINEVFSKYTVLFVGYSYDDIMVRYLTRAINSNNKSNCYVLTCDETQDWGLYNLNPIFFHDQDYQGMTESLTALGDRAKRGLLDWKAFLEMQCADLPPIDQEASDEITEALEDEKRVKVFLGIVKSKDWLYWLDDHHYLDGIFDSSRPLTSRDELYLRWISKHFLDKRLFTLLCKHNNTLNPKAADLLLYNASKSLDKKRYSFILSGLLPYITESNCIYFAMERLIQDEEYNLAWIAFTMYFNNSIVFKRTVSFSKDQEIQASYGMDRINLIAQSWEALSVGIDMFDYKALRFIEDFLDNMSDIFNSLQDEVQTDENYSYLYSIENDIDIPHDELISIIPQMADSASKSVNKKTPEYVYNWVIGATKSKSILLKRIALLVLRKYCDIDADKKLLVLMDYFDLYDLYHREQIFKLVSAIFSDLSGDLQEQLVSALINRDISNIENNDNQRLKIFNYEIFNWFVWLKKEIPGNQMIMEAFEKIQREHPSFKEREHPELVMYSSASYYTEEDQYSLEELEKMDYSFLVRIILESKGKPLVEGASSENLLNAVTTLSANCLEWSKGLFAFLLEEHIKDKLIWHHLFKGFQAHVNNRFFVLKVLGDLNDTIISEQPKDVAEFIYCVLNNNKEIDYDDEVWNKALLVTNKLIDIDYYGDIVGDDFEIMALNNLPGILARIYVQLTCLCKMRTIPPLIQNSIDELLIRDNLPLEMVCVFVGFSGGFFARDPVWTKARVLPFLHSENRDMFKAAWEGLLAFNRSYYHDFANVVIDYFFSESSRIKFLDDRHRRQYILHYALLIIYESDDPLEKHMPAIYTNDFRDDEKALFVERLSLLINKLEDEGKNNIWNNWAKKYLENRLVNIPEPIHFDEVAVLIKWPFIFEDSFDEVEQLIARIEVNHISVHGMFELFDYFNDRKLTEKYPDSMAELLIFVVSKAETIGLFKKEIMSSIEMLKARVENGLLRTKLEELEVSL